MKNGKPPYTDLHKLSEDQRINLIGTTVTERKKTVGFIVDLEGGNHEKGDRYIKKLAERFPGVRVLFRGDGPIPKVETIKVGPPL